MLGRRQITNALAPAAPHQRRATTIDDHVCDHGICPLTSIACGCSSDGSRVTIQERDRKHRRPNRRTSLVRPPFSSRPTFDTQPPRQSPPVGIVLPVISLKSESSAPGSAAEDRSGRQRCKPADASQILLRACPTRPARSTCGYRPGHHSSENMPRERSRFDVATRRSSPSLKTTFAAWPQTKILSLGAECSDNFWPASDGLRRAASSSQCTNENAITVRASQAHVIGGRSSDTAVGSFETKVARRTGPRT